MGTLYERIQGLSKAKGVAVSRMCIELGLSKSTMSDLKNGRTKSLSTATAQKIAEYFGVSLGFLLAEEEEKTPTNAGERDILDEVDLAFYGDYKGLDENDKETVRDMVRLMRDRQAKKSKTQE